MRVRRPSAQTIAVVRALADEPASWRYGYELCAMCGIKSGSMYPILIRLTDRGLLETRWETDIPAGRPPRHLYRLTGDGVSFAAGLAEADTGGVARSVSGIGTFGAGGPVRGTA
ncbi:PadR family transcriptional regulator [Nocardia cyriacigeorgica]|uniref:PadR family transcriptional regulator n=1 Tax=Nocardia cyriacigeorgica TaxID=135487 RepID=UPI002454E089|nr:PadR family transcriptional regulator [Nocardia cyriacigeorgica]